MLPPAHRVPSRMLHFVVDNTQSNALIQLQARYHRREAASEKCLSAATFVEPRERQGQSVTSLRSTKLTAPSRRGIRAISTGWVIAAVPPHLAPGEIERTAIETLPEAASDAPSMRIPYPPDECDPSATTTSISREKSTTGIVGTEPPLNV